MFDNLFSPIKIRGLELKNRVKFPATASCLDTEGYINDLFIDYHTARARGGAAMNTTEDARVHAGTATSHNLGIWDDSHIPGMKKLADAVHAEGGTLCIQFDQGGIANFFMDPKKRVFIPSEFNFFGMEFKGVDVEMIREVAESYGTAAARAVKAGADAIELHCGHGYACHGFFSPYMNKRTDEYGGTPENRARFIVECIQAMRKNVPDDFPLIMRVSAIDDDVPGGATLDDVIQLCKYAKEAGIDAVDVSRGNAWGMGSRYIVAPMDIPRGFNVENARRIKEETGLIVIVAGRINDPQQAEDIIASGAADMVDMGRAQIVDPEFCNKSREGRVDELLRCIGCSMGCMDRCHNPQYPHISCLWNPSVAQEKEYELKATDTPKNIVVIGGGPGGMEASITLSKRGHKVTLVEKNKELGGNFILASYAPRKGEIYTSIKARAKHVTMAGVNVMLNTLATPELLAQLKPDQVILATGGTPIALNIPGADAANVVGYVDAMEGKKEVSGNVAVIGGGLVGLEVAEILAEKGCAINVVEMADKVGADLGNARNICVQIAMRMAGIKQHVKAKAVEVKANALVVDKAGTLEEIPADYVVVAVGSKPLAQTAITEYCEANNIPLDFIGDVCKPGKAIDAIADAAALARKL